MKSVESINYTIGIMGAGYVGKPLISEFGKQRMVYAYDTNSLRIHNLRKENISQNIVYTDNSKFLQECDAIIVCVPTPINNSNEPDLADVIHACNIIGSNIKKDTLIVFESSYAPETTMKICVPIIERVSNKTCGKEFYVGYSPERVNPGDEIHTLKSIVKVISAQNDTVLKQVESLYSLIDGITLYKASSIEVAEFSKLLENTQRDVNIALMNEMARLCHLCNLNIKDILDAARTKWNFYDVKPGLVGGHCIGVDPYYLLNFSREHNFDLTLVNNARNINEMTSDYIIDSLMFLIKENFSDYSNIKIGIYGYSYKSDSDDTRNTKVRDVYNKLCAKNLNCKISDYNLNDNLVDFVNYKKFYDLDILIVAVDHEQYRKWSINEIKSNFNGSENKKIIIDLNSIFINFEWPENYLYWNL